MKAEHRHELKTNELAQWLGNLPQWTRENLVSIIVVLVVMAAAGLFYLWRAFGQGAVAQRQSQLTALVGQLAQSKIQILSQQDQKRDLSYILLEPAGSLKTYAEQVGDGRMAALALIKRAEALRAELHYRLGAVSRQDLADQIARAKESYSRAIERAPSDVSLRALAKFGLGLCEEELGNFDEAEKIYRDITRDPNLVPTVAFAQAEHRVNTMADYKQSIVLRPAPLPKPVKLPEPATSAKSAEPNRPVDVNAPVDANLQTAVKPPLDVNQQPAPVNAPAGPDANKAAKTPDAAAKVTDVNVPGK